MNNQPPTMFIDTLEERYPDRALIHLELEHSGFEIIFKLQNEHHLSISLNMYEHNEQLVVYESVKEYEKGKMYHSQGNDYRPDGSQSSILSMLKGYLQTAIGGVEHTYKESFVGLLAEQMLKNDRGG